jgi:D-glycero-D-manno-heptose 1,7-bisphosphate phosphatase
MNRQHRDKRLAVFLDRDGTINEDVGYPKKPEHIRLLPGAGDALAKIKEKGYLLIIVSNQSGIGRGIINEDEAEQVHNEVTSSLSEYGVKIDAAYYCPHDPDERCSCRKPSPEMLFRAANELDIDLHGSFMVGNEEADIEAGKRAGCQTILLASYQTSSDIKNLPDFVAANWQAALRFILNSV